MSRHAPAQVVRGIGARGEFDWIVQAMQRHERGCERS